MQFLIQEGLILEWLLSKSHIFYRFYVHVHNVNIFYIGSLKSTLKILHNFPNRARACVTLNDQASHFNPKTLLSMKMYFQWIGGLNPFVHYAWNSYRILYFYLQTCNFNLWNNILTVTYMLQNYLYHLIV